MGLRNIRAFAGALLIMIFPLTHAAGLKAGDPAPSFELMDQNGKLHTLADYRGRWLVLYFYPKDDTPGCTTEACEFRDDVVELKRLGATVLGISTDDVKSHREFADKYHLSFPLLSDSDGEVARSYGSLVNLALFRFAKRHTFIIDGDGRIAKIYRSVDPKTHSDEVIRDLAQLQS